MIEIVSVEMTTCDSCGEDIEFAESHDALEDKMKAACHECYIDELEQRIAELEDALLDEERKCIDLELECNGLQDQLDDAPLEATDAKVS